jgi:hypothetical protein
MAGHAGVAHLSCPGPAMNRRASPVFRKAFQLLCWEAAFAMAYETWIGPTYLSGLAGELGLGVGFVTLLTAVPFMGAVGQLGGVWALRRASSCKSYTLKVTAFARAIWIVPVLATAAWALRASVQGGGFPRESWSVMLAAVACASALFATCGGTSWSFWVRNLVPAHVQGRFFGVRHRYVMVGVIVAHALATFWVGWKPGGWFAGYWVVACLAILAAALSTALLGRVPEPRDSDAVGAQSSAIGALAEPFRDARFRRVLLFGATFQGAMQLASPYFAYYFTKELHIPMGWVAFCSVLANVGCFLAAARWGRLIDRTGNPVPVVALCGLGCAVSPLMYVLPGAAVVRWIGPVDFLLNGMIHGGFTIAFTTLLFRVIPSQRGAAYFSVYTACAGVSAALAILAGGFLATALVPWGGLRALWVVAAVLRIAVVLGMLPLLREAARMREPEAPAPETRPPGPGPEKELATA